MKSIFSHNYVLLALGLILTLGGTLGVLVWNVWIGVITIQFTLLILLVLSLLQRRQTARMQERVLKLLKTVQQPTQRVREPAEGRPNDSEKRILDVLHAQQVSMELLAKRFDDVKSNADTSHN